MTPEAFGSGCGMAAAFLVVFLVGLYLGARGAKKKARVNDDRETATESGEE